MRLFVLLLLLPFTLALAPGCGGDAEAPGDADTEATSSDATPGAPSIDAPPEPIPFRPDGTLHVVQGGTTDTVVTVAIEIAATDSARTRGLMQRAALPERSGMLFVFEREQLRRFWMANTPLALDIAFADADSQIVRIAKYTTPFSSESIPSGEAARFVLEVPAGFADTYGLTEGDRLTWRRTP
jgi:hypothetical protein